jgi:hypothetical protein
VSSIVGGLVFVAVILAVAAHGARPPAPSAVPTWLLGRLAALLGRWTPLMVGLGVTLALSYVVLDLLRWSVFIPRALRTRVAYAILPPPDFDPRPEAIEAFGQQLLGARRRVLAWLDRPASGIRIRLTTTPDGRLLYLVELPARFRGSLFNAYATAYPAVDVRPVEEIAGGTAAQGGPSEVGEPASGRRPEPGGAGTAQALPAAAAAGVARHESREGRA